MNKKHSGRAHSKFSASGAERWFNCPGSVELSEGLPDTNTPWSIEGTKAHEVLEELMQVAIENGIHRIGHARYDKNVPREMVAYGTEAANFILKLHAKLPDSEIAVESRVHLDFIHPDMFGTYDAKVIEHFGTLHIFDYKYGVSPVSAVRNLQMIFYGIGVAHQFHWNFKNVRLWIIQPRVSGYNGPTFWDVPIKLLKQYVGEFKRAVDRVENNPKQFVEGEHCHWCKAKDLCPLKRAAKVEKAKKVFSKI